MRRVFVRAAGVAALGSGMAAALAIAPAMASHHGGASNGPLAPRDECEGVPGLQSLQSQVRQAAEQRDADALLALTDENVKLDFGGGSGRAELRRRLTAPDYALWRELDRALALGCGTSISANGDGYAAWPWYFAKDLIPLDPYEATIVTGNGVRLRSGPSASAPVIGKLSWDYVRRPEFNDDDYAKVITRDGREGYMAQSYLRSLVDYRVVANMVDGEWKITAFIAGD